MADQLPTIESLIMRAGQPDNEHAWEEFEAYYKGFIYSVIRGMGAPQRDQDDLAQIVLVKLWKSLASFKIDGKRAKFRTWLSTVIRNAVFDFADKERRFDRKKQEFREETALWYRNPSTQHSRYVEREWQMHVTNLAMDAIRSSFSDRAIEVFSMSLDGKSIEEISEEMGIKPNSVYKVKNRVKSRLVKEVKRLREELEWT